MADPTQDTQDPEYTTSPSNVSLDEIPPNTQDAADEFTPASMPQNPDAPVVPPAPTAPVSAPVGAADYSQGAPQGFDPNSVRMGPDGNPIAYDVVMPDGSRVQHSLIPGVPPRAIPPEDSGRGAPAMQPQPQSSAGMQIPMGTTTETRTSSKQIRPEDQAAMDEAQSHLNDAYVNQTEAFKNEQIARNALAAKQATEFGLEAQRQQAAAADFQTRVQARQAENEAMVDKLANTKIDANHYWADSSTGNKVASGIAILLGALGQGFAGGTNPVIDAIDKRISQDIEIQKFNLTNQREMLTEKRGILSDYMKQFNDVQAATNAAKATYWKSISAQLEANVQNAGTQAQAAAGQAALAEAQGKQAQAMAGLNAITTEKESKSAPMLGMMGKPVDEKTAQENELHQKIIGLTEDLQKGLEGGTYKAGTLNQIKGSVKGAVGVDTPEVTKYNQALEELRNYERQYQALRGNALKDETLSSTVPTGSVGQDQALTMLKGLNSSHRTENELLRRQSESRWQYGVTPSAPAGGSLLKKHKK